MVNAMTLRLLIGIVLVSALGVNVDAQNWPQWRGPAASGVSSEARLPDRWSDTDNVAWKAKLRGLGISSPIVWGDLVFVTSQAGSGEVRPGPRLVQSGNPLEAGEKPLGSGPTAGDSRVTFLVSALDRRSGRTVWEFEHPAEGPLPSVHEKHNLASPSPATDGERVYAWFGTGQIAAVDLAGKLVWKKHLGTTYGPFDINWGHALEYFTRARTLAPGDPDVVQGYEALVLAYGHSITFEGFIDSDTTGVRSSYGSLVGSVRVVPRLSLGANARFRRRTGTSDALGGGGFVWRVARATNLSFSALVGDGNTVLPTSDVFGDITHYVGAYEIGGMVRRLSFSGVNVAAFSPVFAWDPGPTRFDVRYTYSQSTFSDSGESTGDHSVFVRETWRRWRRASVNVAYAYGIESFEDLTVDRIGSLGASTLALGARFTAPSLTMIATTWEHQWRSNSTALDRFTVGIVQFFP